MEALVSEAAETDFASHQAFKWFQDSTCWTREMHVFPTAFLHQAPYPVEVGSLSPWHDTLHAKHTSHVSQGGGNDWSTASKDLQGCSTPKSSWPCKKSIFGIDIAMTLPNILGISGRCLTGVWLGLLMVSNIQLNYNLAFESLFGSNLLLFGSFQRQALGLAAVAVESCHLPQHAAVDVAACNTSGHGAPSPAQRGIGLGCRLGVSEFCQ